jgi:hypothetical protein
MNILVVRKLGCLISSLLTLFVLAGCGDSGVSVDTLRPLWTKQVNQEVTPLMKDVFAPISSQITSELVLHSNESWDVPKDKLPNYKYGLQHAKQTENNLQDPTLLIHVRLNQPFASYQTNQLAEQIWSAKQQLSINGIKVGKIMMEYNGKIYVDASLQAINEQGDIESYLNEGSKG